ncbi:helix-turn-helix transcriptional regulator [Brevibacillus sp. AG]|uniref:helix-turn-helix domain-containing protein n=1 Tax=Brevibacillus sp. AG TaxID=3020891 RepID=UPI00232B32DB|nr:helix-turn-helix transcriptional regulator [Brevibacillus sp. AG]MDC0763466.1 helix-turn-helix transcriptional regulator [Brevibacillus sp. AG]
MTSFGMRLRELREGKDLSQEELGAKFGLGKVTISGYELSKRQPTLELIVGFAEFFGVSTDYLLGRSNDPFGVSPDTSKNAIKISKILGNMNEDEQEKFFAFLEMTFRDKMPK